MLRDRWSIGSGVSRKVDCRDCGRGNAPGGPVAWMRSNCEESMPLFARRPAIWDWAGLCGTARPWRPGLRKSMGPVSYTHLRAHETRHDLVCRLLLEKKKR